MEKKICKKCSSELPEDQKGARCEECKAERMRGIKKIGLAVGAAFFMAGVIFFSHAY
jgi:Zn finger protein HypA/HybF involved in hydrogenase expression